MANNSKGKELKLVTISEGVDGVEEILAIEDLRRERPRGKE